MAKTIVGLFDEFEDARATVRSLTDAGISRDNISVAANRRGAGFSDRDELYTVDRAREIRDERGDAGITDPVAIVPMGGLLAGGMSSMSLSGIGAIFAAGPLIATLAGAGAQSGGVIAALVEAGVPEKHAKYYAEGVRRGGTLITVTAAEHLAQRALEVFHNHGAVDIDRRAEHFHSTGYSGYDPNAPAYEDDEIAREREAWRGYERTPALRGDPGTEVDRDDEAIDEEQTSGSTVIR
ncbi:hypothetical protein CCAX7_009610 [Capsulimonas corticalis]|uniref:Uncharacterized protein n=1 Tax=Capsulimonas corticalis TaxID=2219043 RepID=A0A402CUA9_9BACT|nr:hypothetical protein [Capsulimonas corticalis]BDI28910.1 hypothetical protein CCAX7_009610 [Capsulimonas corticalis]